MILMCGRKDEEKAESLLAYLGGDVKRRYKSKYLYSYRLSDEGRDFDGVCRWLTIENATKPEPHELIRKAMEATLDPSNILTSSNQINDIYENDSFNEIAIFRMLKEATEKLVMLQ